MSPSENHPRLPWSGSCPPGLFCVTPPLALVDWTTAGPLIPHGPIWFSPGNLGRGGGGDLPPGGLCWLVIEAVDA